MAQVASRQSEVETSDLLVTLSDAANLAEEALSNALDFAALKTRLDSADAVIDCLRRGDKAACEYVAYGLAREVSNHFVTLVPGVEAVYLCDLDATPQDICFGEGTGLSLLHLIIHAERKTAALDSLAGVLDRALVERYASVTGKEQLAHLLDVQVVDDTDIENRTGYGAMLTSIHNRPVLVCQR